MKGRRSRFVVQLADSRTRILSWTKIARRSSASPGSTNRLINLTGGHHVSMRLLLLRCTEEKHALRLLVVFSEEGCVAGTVFVDADIAQTLETGAYEFVALSRTTSEEDLGYREHTRYFDYTRYSLRKYWPLYNVLLVQRDTSGA